jgi:hypothetical protein
MQNLESAMELDIHLISVRSFLRRPSPAKDASLIQTISKKANQSREEGPL